MARVKICGVNSAAAFDAAAEAGADWIGFVFFAGSPRYVTPRHAAVLSARGVGGPARVGLFVTPTDAEIAGVLSTVGLDVLQVYAPAARVAEICARFKRPVWRSVGVRGLADLPVLAHPAAALLVEPRVPASATRPGGNGQAWDWSVLRFWQPEYAWLLAGGLTPGNVAQAIAASGAAAVDVSSGVESEPGVKSPALIRAFIGSARSAVPEELGGMCQCPKAPPSFMKTRLND